MQLASYNAVDITDNLGAIITNIRAGKGSVGKLFMDTTFANTLGQTMTNVEEGTEAAKHSFLLKGYFKDKEKAKAKELAKEKEAAKKKKDKGN